MSENIDRMPTTKTITIASAIDFSALNLPTEDTQTCVEKTASNGLKTCDKLNVNFTRINSKQVYGSKKDKIEKDAHYINNIDRFLAAVYNSSDASGDDEKDADMSYDQWRDKLAFQRAQTILMQRARTQALKLENTNIDTTIANLDSMAQSGKLDLDALEKMQSMIDAARAMMSAQKSA